MQSKEELLEIALSTKNALTKADLFFYSKLSNEQIRDLVLRLTEESSTMLKVMIEATEDIDLLESNLQYFISLRKQFLKIENEVFETITF